MFCTFLLLDELIPRLVLDLASLDIRLQNDIVIRLQNISDQLVLSQMATFSIAADVVGHGTSVGIIAMR